MVGSSFPGLDFLSMLNRRGIASPKNNLGEKQKRRSTPDSGGTAPGKTSYSSVEAAAWGIRRGILENLCEYSIWYFEAVVNTIFRILTIHRLKSTTTFSQT